MRSRWWRSLTFPPSALRIDHAAGPARGLDLLPRARAEAVCRDAESLALELAVAQHLHGNALALREPAPPQRLGRHLGAVLEAVEVDEVDALGVGSEGFEWH